MNDRLLSLSLDLDNLWSYQKIHGDPGWEAFPSYLDDVAELVAERVARHELALTVFVVGQDAALEKNRAAFGRLAGAGVEFGNHSFNHEPWLHLRSYGELDDEIGNAERAIDAATGQRPIGFRGPGFSLSENTLLVLAQRGYLYDASTLPTYLGPLARLYYFWKSRGLSADERRQRARLFGTVRDGLRPVKPYFWPVPGTPLLEIPVTTVPVAKVPFHMSYLLYLASFSPTAARAYLRTAVTTCRLGGVEPSFLLHPLDFLGGDRVPQLAFFPGMSLSTDFKLRWFDETMAYLKSHFRIVAMAEHARTLLPRAPHARALPGVA